MSVLSFASGIAPLPEKRRVRGEQGRGKQGRSWRMPKIKHAGDVETTQEPTASLPDDQRRLGQPVRVMHERARMADSHRNAHRGGSDFQKGGLVAWAYLDTVSESPMTVRECFGLVMATVRG